MRKQIAAACAFAAILGTAGASQAATVFAQQIDVSGGAAGVWDASAAARNNDRADPANALGAPDSIANQAGGFYSLGIGGIAVFDFGTLFDTEASVFEVTFGCSSSGCSSYPESADLYAFDGDWTPTGGAIDLAAISAFTFIDSIPNGLAQGGATISLASPFRYLALRDTSAAGAGRDGFDVDAVSVSAVPLPASALFLLAGLGGFGFLRARRAA